MTNNELFYRIFPRRKERPGDFRDEDGILYCGKCGQPKEAMELEGDHAGLIFRASCLCDIEREKKWKEEQRQLEEEQRRFRVGKLRAECLPRRNMRNMCFETAEDTKAIRTAKQYTENWETYYKDGTGLIFWGNCGSGKSFAALCIANAILEKEQEVFFCSCVDLVSDMMDRERRYEIREHVESAPLMVLDDLGAERETEFAREQLCRVIDMRLETGRPLICTTNYSLAEMKEVTNPAQMRTFDRVLSVCIPVRVVGSSRRKAIAQQKLTEFRSLTDLQAAD